MLDATGAVISWEAPATGLPLALNIYKVVPKNFPIATVTNLIGMAEFKEPGKVLAILKVASEGKEAVYQEPGTKKFLGFYPASGSIIYLNHAVVPEPGQVIENIPTEQQALDLALKILPQVGIERNELALRKDGELEIRRGLRRITRHEKQTKKKIEEIVARDVMINRRLHGVNFEGVGLGGGIEIRFGNDAKAGSLRTVWRKLEPFKQVTVPDAQALTQMLKSGKAVVDGSEAAKAGKIQIKSVTVYYFEKWWGEPQSFVYPYITLEAITDTDKGLILIDCPMAVEQ